MKTKVRQIALTLLKILFAVGILFWLYQKGVLDLKGLSQLLQPRFILGFLGLLGLNFYFVSWRWQILLAAHHIRLSRWETFKLNLIGLFFNHIMPGGVGGDVVKGFYIIKDHPQNRMGAGISVLLDRVLGLYAMIIMALFALILNFKDVLLSSQLLLIFKATLVLFIVFNIAVVLALSSRFNQWGWKSFLEGSAIGRKLISAYNAVHYYSHNLKTLVKAIVLSLMAQTIAVIIMWQIGGVLSFESVSWKQYLSVVPLGFMVTAIPISPAGVGVGQMAFYFLFNLYLGYESQVGPSVITGFQLLNFLLGLFGIIFFIQRKSSLQEIETANVGS